jgi:hypothetical protein
MDGGVYYLVLGALSLAAAYFFKTDKWMLAFIFVALAGWTYYSHESGITFGDLKEDLNKAVDESANKKYESGIRNEGFEYNKSKVK